MRTSLLIPLIVTVGLLGAVTLNEVTQGGLSETFGAGHHHLVSDDHAPCPADISTDHAHSGPGTDRTTCPEPDPTEGPP